jgi:predicted  nucleic acid-binding Zn-ribbon protein
MASSQESFATNQTSDMLQINQNLSSVQVLMKSEDTRTEAHINQLNESVDRLNQQLDAVVIDHIQELNGSLHHLMSIQEDSTQTLVSIQMNFTQQSDTLDEL